MLTQETVAAIKAQLLHAEPMIYGISELWTLDMLTHALMNYGEQLTPEVKATYLLLCLEAHDDTTS